MNIERAPQHGLIELQDAFAVDQGIQPGERRRWKSWCSSTKTLPGKRHGDYVSFPATEGLCFDSLANGSVHRLFTKVRKRD